MTAERERHDADRRRQSSADKLDLLFRDELDFDEEDRASEDSGSDSFLERFPTAVREPVRPRGGGS